MVFERGDEVLLMRRAGTGFFDGLYSLPGGHVEAGESILAAAARECAEELAVGVEAAQLHMLGVVHRLSDTNRVDFFVRAAQWTGTARIAEPHKCDALGWYRRDALPPAMVPYVAAALAAGAGPWVLELGWA